jgi:starch synthase
LEPNLNRLKRARKHHKKIAQRHKAKEQGAKKCKKARISLLRPAAFLCAFDIRFFFRLYVRTYKGDLVSLMRILFIASEVTPFAKTGGLADVAGALPRALQRLGHDVRIILPYYQSVEERGFETRKGRRSVEVTIGGDSRKAQLRQFDMDGVPVYFVDYRPYFFRDGLYGTAAGDYPDNAQRFAFFCRAALAFLPRLGWRPDVLHLHDWQTGLVPVLLRTELKKDPFFAGMPSVLTIHNLGYQGLFPPEILPVIGVDRSLFAIDGIEYYGKVSFLKGGLVFSDLLTTVSPTYCREIQSPEMGFGLDGVLRARASDLFGVLNGIDVHQWDPSLDSALPFPYGCTDLRGKGRSKKALQKELGLTPSSAVPIVAMVTRLDTQKGLDLVEEAWNAMMQRNLQFVILGSGEEKHTRFFAALRDRYPGKISIHLGFDDALARRIYAGSDIFLMPSHYEPCGLGQLIALRYGALPLVRRTGGLADTITDPREDPSKANGFTFTEASPRALLSAADRALALFADRRAWLKMVRRGMSQDISWGNSAQTYLELYAKAQKKVTG